MTTHPVTRGPSPKVGRIIAMLAYDGPIATALLRVFQFFLVAVSFVACLAPVLLFDALVGWQPTHLALWLGAASLLPVAPAVLGALSAARRVLLVSGGTGPARTFWRGFARGVRSLWWLAAAMSAAVLVIGYDLALMGDSDTMLLFATLGLSLLLVLVVGISSVAESSATTRPRALTVAAVRAIIARPHVALSWVLLIAAGVGASILPMIGGTVALFAPALVASAIVICNRTLNFIADDKELSW
ncbi:hypothetical protein ACSBPH_04350 [Microbacterium sp. F51-2R]|uniref:hypothetical protein n=1 Tax=Microbacterium sp. F51-2R TaxID=3445777 RepID=UPI003F9EE745